MKKTLFTLILALASMSAFAQFDDVEENFTENGITYRAKGSTCWVIGTTLTDLVIPETVRGYKVIRISDYGGRLNGKENIKSIVIPKSVTKLYGYTFDYCENLESVTLPEGLKEIGYGDFRGCTKLKQITLPSTLSRIGGHAFLNTGISSLTIPESVSRDSVKACIQNCNIKTINIPKHWTKYPENFFSGVSLPSYTIPQNIKILDNELFEDAEIGTLVIPSSVGMIDDYTFSDSKIKRLIIESAKTLVSVNAYGRTTQPAEYIEVEGVQRKFKTYPTSEEISAWKEKRQAYLNSTSSELQDSNTLQAKQRLDALTKKYGSKYAQNIINDYIESGMTLEMLNEMKGYKWEVIHTYERDGIKYSRLKAVLVADIVVKMFDSSHKVSEFYVNLKGNKVQSVSMWK